MEVEIKKEDTPEDIDKKTLKQTFRIHQTQRRRVNIAKKVA
jgi:hypothetical protein